MSVVEATPNQFPFLVGILADGVSASDGILISPEWVLTSAAKVTGNSSVQLSFGAHFKDEWDKVSQMKSTEFYLHDQYAPSSFANNLALIRLPNPVSLDAKVQPITRLSRTENFIGQAAKSVGWGIPIVNNLSNVVTLTPQIVDASIVETRVAIAHFGQQYNHPGQIAVDISKATIHTSTLITQGLNGWELVGLFNFGAIAIGGPEVYSRVAYFEDWIWRGTAVGFD